MKFLSKIFRGASGSRDDAVMHKMFERVQRIIDDEEFQLELLHPTMRDAIKSSPAYDMKPNATGSFGFSATNPIPVNGPIGELSYLSRLEVGPGNRLMFHRLGPLQVDNSFVDVFEAVTFNGSQWFILFLDMYHSKRSRLVPDGLSFTKEVPQFSGFNTYCEDFPYDFAKQKSVLPDSGLVWAYIAMGKVSPYMERQVFQRPVAQSAKIELLKSKISGV